MKFFKKDLTKQTVITLLAVLLTFGSAQVSAAKNDSDPIAEGLVGLFAIGMGLIFLESMGGGESTDTSSRGYGSEAYMDPDIYGSSGSTNYGTTDYSGEYGCAWGSRDYGTCH